MWIMTDLYETMTWELQLLWKQTSMETGLTLIMAVVTAMSPVRQHGGSHSDLGVFVNPQLALLQEHMDQRIM